MTKPKPNPNALLLMLCVCLASCGAEMPDNLGLKDGKLLPCPDSPNCVSTMAEQEEQKMKPMDYATTQTKAQQDILNIVQGMKRTRVITSEKGYLHATFTTPVFGFIDDVEFYFDDANNLIHFRSASRVGYSDLGVNRSRMKKVVKKFSELRDVVIERPQ